MECFTYNEIVLIFFFQNQFLRGKNHLSTIEALLVCFLLQVCVADTTRLCYDQIQKILQTSQKIPNNKKKSKITKSYGLGQQLIYPNFK